MRPRSARPRPNIAARIGDWSVRHRKTAIFGWLLFVTAAALTVGVGQQQMRPDEYTAGDSAKAMRILDEAGLRPGDAEMLLVHSDMATADAAGFQGVVQDLIAGVRATGQVADLRDPYAIGLISADRHDALVQFTMTGESGTGSRRVQPVLDAVAAVRDAHPEMRIEQFGEASVGKWADEVVMGDFRRAEWTAVPVSLGILLVAFGALLAAVLPVGLALTAFLAANGLLALVSHRMHLDTSASSVMLLIGLAVGVDYCLFYLRREREERAAGRDPAAALRIAAATSGRSVLVSGLTVVVAMSGMFLSGTLIFAGFAVATIMVVLIAMLGSVTVLPATLSLLGDRVDFARFAKLMPRVTRRRDARRPLAGRSGGGGRIWAAILRGVLARPVVSATLSGVFLLVLAIPVLGMHTEKLGLDKQLPGAEVVQTYEHIAAAFPGGPEPAEIVVRSDDIAGPEVQRAIDEFTTAAVATGAANQPIQTAIHPEQGVAVITVPLAGDGEDEASSQALRTLRSEVVPETLSKVDGVEAYVGGGLSFSIDFNDQLKASILPVLIFVTAMAFLLMLVSFRSATIAAVSVLLNALSAGAAFGVMTAVFQHGWGANLVGTEGIGAIESWIPLFAFVVLFGLSMDYHVFVVSRIREAHDRGLTTRAAVAEGIRATAGVVTSAAAIMVAVFAVLGSLSMADAKQLGVGLAVAILLDATVVRVVLLPSALALLGERAWYLPRWLSWLPQARHELAGPPEPAAPLAPELVGAGA